MFETAEVDYPRVLITPLWRILRRHHQLGCGNYRQDNELHTPSYCYSFPTDGREDGKEQEEPQAGR
jgi:hypothetical protein